MLQLFSFTFVFPEQTAVKRQGRVAVGQSPVLSLRLKIIILHKRIQPEFAACLCRQQTLGDAFCIQEPGQEQFPPVSPAAGHVDVHDIVITDIVA